MAAASKSKKKSGKKSGGKKSRLESDAKDRKKDRKKSADSKARPKGRPDVKKDGKKPKKDAAKSKAAAAKATAGGTAGGKAKQAAAAKSGQAKAGGNAGSSKAGSSKAGGAKSSNADDARLEKVAADAARAAERAATRTEPAPKPRPAKAERRPSGPAPSPRPAVRRSGLETSTPAGAEVPSTVQRSDAHAQATWSAAHDSAVEQYGEGERAHRTAFAALKHTYEKVGDHWEAKAEAGPSDSRAESAGRDEGTPAGGVDANASRAHLYRLAQRLDIARRSTMTKDELVQGVQRANAKATAQARGN